MNQPTTTPDEEQREQLIRTAIDLIESHRFALYNTGDPVENIIRMLDERGMLTSHEQRETETANAISAHRTFGVVPSARFQDERVRASRYIAALERAVYHLLAGVDAVSGLTGITKTAKGQRLLEKTAEIRPFVKAAREKHRDSETQARDYL